MFRIICQIVVFISLVFPVINVQAQVDVESQNQIAIEAVRKSWCSFRSVRTEIEKAKITVVYDGGDKEEKSLTRWMKFDPKGIQDRVAIEITAAKKGKGTKLLIWRNKGPNNIWLKMKKWTKIRSMSGNNQKGYFINTDFSIKDTDQLSGEDTDDYSYLLLDETEEYWLIESSPKKNSKKLVYIYSKREIKISKKNWAYLEVRYFKGKRTQKVLTNLDIEVKQGAWRPKETVIDNKELKRKTYYKVVDSKLGIEIPGKQFNKAFIDGK